MKEDFQPCFTEYDFNLKRKGIWNCAEVHAIYGFWYTLCTSKEGINHFRYFLSCNDQKVFEPLFIAQYLLMPVNTIAKNYLYPMMIKPYDAPGKKNRQNSSK